MNKAIFQPYGLMFIVKEGEHYSKLLFRSSSDSPLFKVGTPLPENLLKFLKLDPGYWDKLTWDGVKQHNKNLIHSENNSLRHYEVTLPGEEVYKQFFDDFDKNNANDSCHTAYIKYLPSYVAACSILSNLKTNFKLSEDLKRLNDVSELKYNE